MGIRESFGRRLFKKVEAAEAHSLPYGQFNSFAFKGQDEWRNGVCVRTLLHTTADSEPETISEGDTDEAISLIRSHLEGKGSQLNWLELSFLPPAGQGFDLASSASTALLSWARLVRPDEGKTTVHEACLRRHLATSFSHHGGGAGAWAHLMGDGYIKIRMTFTSPANFAGEPAALRSGFVEVIPAVDDWLYLGFGRGWGDTWLKCDGMDGLAQAVWLI